MERLHICAYYSVFQSRSSHSHSLQWIAKNLNRHLSLTVKEQNQEFRHSNLLEWIKNVPLKRIRTMESLKLFRQSNTEKKPSPKEEDTTVDPAVAAAVAYTMVYKEDPADGAHAQQKQLEKKLKEIETKDPETYKKLNQHILALNTKYDGEITAHGISRYKSQKYARESQLNTQRSSQPTTPHTPSDESPKHQIKGLLHRQTSLQQEMKLQERKVDFQEQELEKMRQEANEMKDLMAKLTRQAADEALKEKTAETAKANNDAAKANRLTKKGLIIGSTLTVVGILASILGTYYSTNYSNSGKSSPPCLNGTT